MEKSFKIQGFFSSMCPILSIISQKERFVNTKREYRIGISKKGYPEGCAQLAEKLPNTR